MREVPLMWRLLDAMSGVRVIQEDPGMNDILYKRRLDEAREEMFEQRGITREFEQDYVPRGGR